MLFEAYQRFASCGELSEVLVVKFFFPLCKEKCTPTSWKFTAQSFPPPLHLPKNLPVTSYLSFSEPVPLQLKRQRLTLGV